MTNEEALSILAATRNGYMIRAEKAHAQHAWNEEAGCADKATALHMAILALEATCKTENEPTEEPKTDKGMFIPEGESEAEKDDFIGKSLTEIAVKVNQMEKEFDEVLKSLKRQLKNQDQRLWFIENKVEAVDRRVWK